MDKNSTPLEDGLFSTKSNEYLAGYREGVRAFFCIVWMGGVIMGLILTFIAFIYHIYYE